MSIQGVSVSDSAGKFTNFTFHLIKSVAVTQTRPFWFSWFSSGLCESAILIFFLIFALQCKMSYCTAGTDMVNIDILVANHIINILVAMW